MEFDVALGNRMRAEGDESLIAISMRDLLVTGDRDVLLQAGGYDAGKDFLDGRGDEGRNGRDVEERDESVCAELGVLRAGCARRRIV